MRERPDLIERTGKTQSDRSADTRPYVGFIPTMPHSAAGWRIEPPGVGTERNRSLAPRHTRRAAAAGTARDRAPTSHGLRLLLYALFSVDEPIANSSMFVLPKMIASSAFNRSTTCAS